MKRVTLINLIELLMIIFILLGTTKTYAVLQANPQTFEKTYEFTLKETITNIRKMEEQGQSMGLSETINPSTLESESGNNNIDVHMMKNTEYGAILILSASGYGNPEWIQKSKIKSSTGNKTGIYFPDVKKEIYVAAAGSEKAFGVDIKAGKYVDIYTKPMQSKRGDALLLNYFDDTHEYWHGWAGQSLPHQTGVMARAWDWAAKGGENNQFYWSSFWAGTASTTINELAYGVACNI